MASAAKKKTPTPPTRRERVAARRADDADRRQALTALAIGASTTNPAALADWITGRTIGLRAAGARLPTAAALVDEGLAADKGTALDALRIVRERVAAALHKTKPMRLHIPEGVTRTPDEHRMAPVWSLPLDIRYTNWVRDCVRMAWNAAGFRAPVASRIPRSGEALDIVLCTPGTPSENDPPRIETRVEKVWGKKADTHPANRVTRRILVPAHWRRDVHATGMAHAFGPGTLVIGVKPWRDGAVLATFVRQSRGFTLESDAKVLVRGADGRWTPEAAPSRRKAGVR